MRYRPADLLFPPRLTETRQPVIPSGAYIFLPFSVSLAVVVAFTISVVFVVSVVSVVKKPFAVTSPPLAGRVAPGDCSPGATRPLRWPGAQLKLAKRAQSDIITLQAPRRALRETLPVCRQAGRPGDKHQTVMEEEHEPEPL